MKKLRFSLLVLFLTLMHPFLMEGQVGVPKMNDFVGTNMQAKGNAKYYSKFGFLREYHSWGSDIGLSPDGQMRCPTNPYMFNPSYDQTTLLNNDNFYDFVKGRVSPALIDVAPEMRGITAYLGACEQYHTQKPICVDGLAPGFGNTCGNNQHIDWVGWSYKPTITTYLGDITQVSANNPMVVEFVNTSGYSKPVEIYVRFDWNNDGDFDDPGEDVFNQTKTVNGGDEEDATIDAIQLPANTSGLVTMRVAVANALSDKPDPFSLNGNLYEWFDGDAVDYPVYFCNGGNFTVLDPTAVAGYSFAESGAIYIKGVTLSGINDTNKSDNGYENLTKELSFLDAEQLSGSTSFILENRQSVNTNWTISYDNNTLSTNPANLPMDYRISGSFNLPEITPGIHHLTISYGTDQVNVLVVKEGAGCTISTGSLTPPLVPLKQFLINPLVDQEESSTYYDYALWNTLISSKYGEGATVDMHNNFAALEVDATDPVPSFTYLEVGNEEDAYWWDLPEERNTPNTQIQMLPEQYGAMLSAAYDGGCNTMTYNGQAMGIRNVAPGVKVVQAGLTGIRGQFILDMVSYLEKTRTGNCPNLPFDVLNFHHYTTLPAIPGDVNYSATYSGMFGSPGDYTFEASKGHGVSPEQSRLRWMMEQNLSDIVNSTQISEESRGELKKKEVWFSEFGYDTGEPSDDAWAAVPTVGDNTQQETQAQWITRSFLELSAVESEGMRVTKAMVFDLEDRETGGNYLFADCGLIKDKIHNNAPKKSWFHVQTLRNVLGGTEYKGEFTGKTMTHIAGSGAFDVTNHFDEARIFHYQGDYKGQNADILVIWSPNSSDSEGELTLDLKTLVESSSPIEAITLITPRDGDEDGYHVPITDIANSTYTFTGDYAITETPMYVVLNVAEEEKDYDICSEVVSGIRDESCNSLTVEWFSSFLQGIPKPNKVDIYITEGQGTFDVADDRTDFVIADYPFDRDEYNIGNLKSHTDYTVHIVYKWADGTIKVCDANGQTRGRLCRLHDFTITANNGGSNNAANAFDYTGTGCGDWGDDDRDGYINGLDWDADGDGILDAGKTDANGNGLVDLWEAPGKQWNAFPLNGSAPNVVVDFKADVDLKSISFLHARGVGKMKIEFKNCDCVNENWVLYKEVDLSGYMNWYHLGTKPTGRRVSKLRFTINYEPGSSLSISMLSFCGESGECWKANPEPTKHELSEFMKVSVSQNRLRPILSFEPVLIDRSDPYLGYVKEYDIFYQEVNGQELDFSNAAYAKGVLYDGLDKVNVNLKNLQENRSYKAYLLARQRPYKWPCTSPLDGMRPVLLPTEYDRPILTAGDTIIYFNTYKEGEATGTSNSNPTEHLVSASPNPTTGWTTFNWDLTGYSRLLIYSSNTGELVASYQVDATGVSHLADLTGLGNGSYYIRLEGDNLSPLSGQFVKTTE